MRKKKPNTEGKCAESCLENTHRLRGWGISYKSEGLGT